MDRVAVVTGGTRGIGRAISETLHARGYRVLATYHAHGEDAATFREMTGIDVQCWDVSDYASCRSGIARVMEKLGPVDVLVNNAGITADAFLHKMQPEQWWNVINTNLGSMFNMCRLVVPVMRERGFGRIVNISSVNGQRGQAGQTNYAAAKAGILGFTKALALENARKGITVNAIAPGYCDTDMVSHVPADILKSIVASIPVGRLGTPEEIARLAAVLVEDGAGFITGATFSINGGEYMA